MSNSQSNSQSISLAPPPFLNPSASLSPWELPHVRYIVQIYKSSSTGLLQTLEWDPKTPLPLGFPLKYFLEKNGPSFRLRNVHTVLNQSFPSQSFEIPRSAKALEISPAKTGIRLVLTPSHPTLLNASSGSRAIHNRWDSQDENHQKIFYHSTLAGFIALTLLLTVSSFFPKSEETETQEQIIIPPQIAKIIMKATPKSEPADQDPARASQGGASAPAKAAQQQKKAIQTAFRSQALQNAVKGLLNGGMTQLLANSNQILGPKSLSIDSLAPSDTGTEKLVGAITKGNSVALSKLGGQGSGTGKSVGYGAGEKGSIIGQGQGLIDLNTDGAGISTGLTKDEVGKVIHQHMSEVRYCYDSSLLKRPDLEGKIMIDFTIAPSGQVSVSTVKEASVSEGALGDCLLRRLNTWKFPQPKGGVHVQVAYPFIFKSLGR